MTNSGAITLTTGDLTITQSGTSPSFTTTGTITIGAGRVFTISGGTVAVSSGTLGGAGTLALAGTTATITPAFTLGGLSVTTSTATFTTPFTLGALTTSGSTLTLPAGLTTATTALSLTTSTINGTGTLTNASGQTMTVTGGTLNMPLDNQGTLVFGGTGTFTAAVTNAGTGTLRVLGQSVSSTASLTIATGFTNAGAIDLTSANLGFSATLTVTSGTLTNTGVITSSIGAGGPRTINAPVNNTGTLTVASGGTGLLTIGGPFTTSGIVNLKVGGTTSITQYDRLAITGTATLGGTLNVTLVNSFTPAPGNQFTALTTTGALSGTFATTNVPSRIVQPVTYNANAVLLVGQ